MLAKTVSKALVRWQHAHTSYEAHVQARSIQVSAEEVCTHDTHFLAHMTAADVAGQSPSLPYSHIDPQKHNTSSRRTQN